MMHTHMCPGCSVCYPCELHACTPPDLSPHGYGKPCDTCTATPTYEVSGRGFCAWSHDGDHLEVDAITMSLAQIMAHAGATPLETRVANAFEYAPPNGQPEPDEVDLMIHGKFADIRNQYQRETGRKYPPVYFVRIQATATQLSDDECEEYWTKRRSMFRDGEEK